MASKDPAKRKIVSARYYQKNRETIRAKQRIREKNRKRDKQKKAVSDAKYYAKNKETLKPKRARNSRDHMLRHLYGMEQADYDALYVQQEGKCKICLEPIEHTSKGTHIDHDHNTEQVRGLLCRHCNQGLGHFRDNTFRLARAIEYLNAGGAL